jgi:hypothetical protein
MLHLKKLCVGISSFEMLKEWQNQQILLGNPIVHVTRMRPKRKDEILQGGSLYWIIKSKFSAKQKIIELQDIIRDDGKNACKIVLSENLYQVASIKQRPFQGWRYLNDENTPKDVFQDDNNEDIPAELLAELNEFGVV